MSILAGIKYKPNYFMEKHKFHSLNHSFHMICFLPMLMMKRMKCRSFYFQRLSMLNMLDHMCYNFLQVVDIQEILFHIHKLIH